MGVRERIFRLLDRGHVDVDPDEFVDLTTVHVGAGPLLVAQLQQAGIDAIGEDAFNPGTQVLSDYRVMVRRRDLASAAEVSDHRGPR